MSTRPVIGIVTNLERDPHHQFPGQLRLSLDEDHPRSVRQAGGVPVLVPPSSDLGILSDQLSLVDALILTDGPDVDPLAYDAQPHAMAGTPSPQRDRFELEALRLAREAGMPVLAIGRGMQLANVFLGGTLHQDASLVTSQKHAGQGNPELPSHTVTIEPESFLDEAWGVKSAKVNSFHHQVLDVVAPTLEVVARAADGVVEAVEYTGDEFDLVGVQWHPQLMSGSHAQARQLFTWFVDLVAGRWEA